MNNTVFQIHVSTIYKVHFRLTVRNNTIHCTVVSITTLVISLQARACLSKHLIVFYCQPSILLRAIATIIRLAVESTLVRRVNTCQASHHLAVESSLVSRVNTCRASHHLSVESSLGSRVNTCQSNHHLSVESPLLSLVKH